MKPGIYQGISHKDYHAMTDIVSNSYLGRLDKCPAAAKVPFPDSPAMAFGRAVHCFVLEPSKFADNFAVYPKEVNLRTKEGKAYIENFRRENEGKEVIDENDWQKITAMNKSIEDHPLAWILIKQGISEQTIIWDDEDTGLRCKCRPDRIPDGNKGVILDLKTTRSADEYSFKRDVVNLGYVREAGFYLEGFAQIMKADFKDLIFTFIAVEKEEPYRVEVYTLDSDFLDYGWREAKRLLWVEQECRVANFWPAYKNKGAVELNKPGYLQSFDEEG